MDQAAVPEQHLAALTRSRASLEDSLLAVQDQVRALQTQVRQLSEEAEATHSELDALRQVQARHQRVCEVLKHALRLVLRHV